MCMQISETFSFKFSFKSRVIISFPVCPFVSSSNRLPIQSINILRSFKELKSVYQEKRMSKEMKMNGIGAVYQVDSGVGGAGGAGGGATGCFNDEMKAMIAAANASQKPKLR